MDFWKRYLNTDDFKIHPGHFFYSNSNPKKYLCYNNSEDVPVDLSSDYTRGNAYELEFIADKCFLANYFILDIDYRDKGEQRANIRDNRALQSYLKSTTDLYSEYTRNGGVHVVLGCTSRFTILSEKNSIYYSNKTQTRLVFEFKRKCLVWPSNGYESIVQPECKIHRHTPEMLLVILDRILDCFDSKNSHTCLARPVWTKMLSFQSCTTNIIPEISLLPDVENSDDDSAPQSSPSAPDLATIEDVLDLDNYVSAGGSSDSAREPPSKKRKLPSGSETLRKVAKECVDNMVTCGVPVTNLENDSFTQTETTPFEYQCDGKFRKKFLKVVENIQKLPSSLNTFKCSYLSGITMGVEKLHKYVSTMSLTDKPSIYGEHVRIFLHYMLRADNKVEDILEEGVFNTLKVGDPWRAWIWYYCYLITILEQFHHACGRNSQIKKFDDYALYREITLRNTVGFHMTEEESYAEYMKYKDQVSAKICDRYIDSWCTFESFILLTLSVIAINCKVVTAFNYYVDYINLKYGAVDLYMELFLFVELKTYDYKIRFILEEFENGNFEPVAVFSFKNYHWIKANSDLFKCFVQKCFPNLVKVDEFIKVI